MAQRDGSIWLGISSAGRDRKDSDNTFSRRFYLQLGSYPRRKRILACADHGAAACTPDIRDHKKLELSPDSLRDRICDVFVSTPDYRRYILLILFLAAIAAVVIMIAVNAPSDGSVSFRLERIRAWRDPEAYASGKGFQTMQALYAIGSGGLLEKDLATVRLSSNIFLKLRMI